jgi:hypothetical protein
MEDNHHNHPGYLATCPICLNALGVWNDTMPPISCEDDSFRNVLVARNCGHLSHQKCHESWRPNNNGGPRTCEVCRGTVSSTFIIPRDVLFVAPEFTATRSNNFNQQIAVTSPSPSQTSQIVETTTKGKKPAAKKTTKKNAKKNEDDNDAAEAEAQKNILLKLLHGPSPAELYRATMDRLNDEIECGRMGPAELDRLNHEIDLATNDKRCLVYLELAWKIHRRIPIFYSRGMATFDFTPETKFVAWKADETGIRVQDLEKNRQERKAEYSAILQEKKKILNINKKLKRQLQQLKEMAASNGIEINDDDQKQEEEEEEEVIGRRQRSKTDNGAMRNKTIMASS